MPNANEYDYIRLTLFTLSVCLNKIFDIHIIIILTDY